MAKTYLEGAGLTAMTSGIAGANTHVLNGLAESIGQGLQTFAGSSAAAASRANAVSAQAQENAANFNQASANNANDINTLTMANQYGFNSGAAALANEFTQNSWNQAAEWNEKMFNRQMEFNAEQAQINRDWQERMSNTQYQRAVKDMKAAGINPILAANGIQTGVGSGSAASVSAPSMGYANGAQASGGLLGANDASISGYSGQMEYMGGLLGLLSAGINGISSALKSFGGLGNAGVAIADAISKVFEKDSNPTDTINKSVSDGMTNLLKNSFRVEEGSPADKFIKDYNKAKKKNSKK